MTISATDILVPVCSKIPLLYLLTQKVAQKFGYVLGIGNNKTFQRTATTKCPLPNTRNTIGNNNATQRRAKPKCIIPNGGNAAWNDKTLQRRATFKHTIPNASNAIRKN